MPQYQQAHIIKATACQAAGLVAPGVGAPAAAPVLLQESEPSDFFDDEATDAQEMQDSHWMKVDGYDAVVNPLKARRLRQVKSNRAAVAVAAEAVQEDEVRALMHVTKRQAPAPSPIGAPAGAPAAAGAPAGAPAAGFAPAPAPAFAPAPAPFFAPAPAPAFAPAPAPAFAPAPAPAGLPPFQIPAETISCADASKMVAEVASAMSIVESTVHSCTFKRLTQNCPA